MNVIPDVTKSFTVTAGFLVRRKVFTDIGESALQYGLRISMDQVASTARFDVTGPESKVDVFCRAAVKVCNGGPA